MEDNKETKELIDSLYFCAAQCTRCYDACQLEKDNSALAHCMDNDLDCAAICRLTGQLLERKSENTDLFVRLCIEMCERCAHECEKHIHMAHCKECAEACRKCASICSKHGVIAL